MKILVVDDEPSICELLKEFITILGYQVFTACNGEEAVSRFEEKRPDIVLLDIKMPGMSGIDVLRKIKEHDSHVKVIMVSAFGDIDTVRTTLKMGASRHLEKPIDLDLLKKTLLDLQESGNKGGQ